MRYSPYTVSVPDTQSQKFTDFVRRLRPLLLVALGVIVIGTIGCLPALARI